MNETAYQRHLIKKIEQLFLGAIVLENDSRKRQGIPDLVVLYKNMYAILEVKISATAPFRPNQEYYIATFGEYTFSAVIYPAIEDKVLDDLQNAFRTAGQTCLLES